MVKKLDMMFTLNLVLNFEKNGWFQRDAFGAKKNACLI